MGNTQEIVWYILILKVWQGDLNHSLSMPECVMYKYKRLMYTKERLGVWQRVKPEQQLIFTFHRAMTE